MCAAKAKGRKKQSGTGYKPSQQNPFALASLLSPSLLSQYSHSRAFTHKRRRPINTPEIRNAQYRTPVVIPIPVIHPEIEPEPNPMVTPVLYQPTPAIKKPTLADVQQDYESIPQHIDSYNIQATPCIVPEMHIVSKTGNRANKAQKKRLAIEARLAASPFVKEALQRASIGNTPQLQQKAFFTSFQNQSPRVVLTQEDQVRPGFLHPGICNQLPHLTAVLQPRQKPLHAMIWSYLQHVLHPNDEHYLVDGEDEEGTGQQQQQQEEFFVGQSFVRRIPDQQVVKSSLSSSAASSSSSSSSSSKVLESEPLQYDISHLLTAKYDPLRAMNDPNGPFMTFLSNPESASNPQLLHQVISGMIMHQRDIFQQLSELQNNPPVNQNSVSSSNQATNNSASSSIPPSRPVNPAAAAIAAAKNGPGAPPNRPVNPFAAALGKSLGKVDLKKTSESKPSSSSSTSSSSSSASGPISLSQIQGIKLRSKQESVDLQQKRHDIKTNDMPMLPQLRKTTNTTIPLTNQRDMPTNTTTFFPTLKKRTLISETDSPQEHQQQQQDQQQQQNQPQTLRERLQLGNTSRCGVQPDVQERDVIITKQNLRRTQRPSPSSNMNKYKEQTPELQRQLRQRLRRTLTSNPSSGIQIMHKPPTPCVVTTLQQGQGQGQQLLRTWNLPSNHHSSHCTQTDHSSSWSPDIIQSSSSSSSLSSSHASQLSSNAQVAEEELFSTTSSSSSPESCDTKQQQQPQAMAWNTVVSKHIPLDPELAAILPFPVETYVPTLTNAPVATIESMKQHDNVVVDTVDHNIMNNTTISVVEETQIKYTHPAMTTRQTSPNVVVFKTSTRRMARQEKRQVAKSNAKKLKKSMVTTATTTTDDTVSGVSESVQIIMQHDDLQQEQEQEQEQQSQPQSEVQQPTTSTTTILDIEQDMMMLQTTEQTTTTPVKKQTSSSSSSSTNMFTHATSPNPIICTPVQQSVQHYQQEQQHIVPITPMVTSNNETETTILNFSLDDLHSTYLLSSKPMEITTLNVETDCDKMSHQHMHGDMKLNQPCDVQSHVELSVNHHPIEAQQTAQPQPQQQQQQQQQSRAVQTTRTVKSLQDMQSRFQRLKDTPNLRRMEGQEQTVVPLSRSSRQFTTNSKTQPLQHHSFTSTVAPEHKPALTKQFLTPSTHQKSNILPSNDIENE